MARMLVMPFGLLNGCAELALKNPPPLVPSCLIASCEASGPPGIACSVIAVAGVGSVERRLVDRDGDDAVTEVLDDALGDQHDGEHQAERQQDAQHGSNEIDPEVAEQVANRCG